MGYPKYVHKFQESKLIDSDSTKEALAEGWFEFPPTAAPIEIIEEVKVKRVRKDESEPTHTDVV